LLGTTEHAGLDQRLFRHRLLGVELLGVDRRLNTTQRDFVEVLREDVLEATLGQATVERHLAALEAVDGDARARALALDAAAAGLAGAGADAAADALARLGGAVGVTQFVEFHRIAPAVLRSE